MSATEEILLKEDIDNYFENHFTPYDFVQVSGSSKIKIKDFQIYCYLTSRENRDTILAKSEWDYDYNVFYPGFNGNLNQHEYYRNCGTLNEAEPLVLIREFDGFAESVIEISEEFRLFHNLYKKNDTYIKFDESGRETIVAKIENKCVFIRLYELRQFLAAKNMIFVLEYQITNYSEQSLEELELRDDTIQKTNSFSYTFSLSTFGKEFCIEGMNSGSRLLGKKLIEPLPIEKCGVYPFDNMDSKFVDFIVATTEEGENIELTCNPDVLTRDKYLTKVCFKKEVLDKYCNKPSTFKVEPSILRCGTKWSLFIDNERNDNIVTVWLGDLGVNLPYEEQLYWKSFNIPVQGEMSDTFFSQQILCQFQNSTQLDALLKYKYEKVKEFSKQSLGWPIFLDLEPGDQHYFDGIRIPSSDEEKDFDSIILGLTKTLIDSINEKEIGKELKQKGISITDEEGKQLPGIKKLDLYFQSLGIEANFSDSITFLMDLQALRSTGMAHRKGHQYESKLKKLGFDSLENIERLKILLQSGVEFLDLLLSYYETIEA